MKDSKSEEWKWWDWRIMNPCLNEFYISYRLRMDQYKSTIHEYIKTLDRNPKSLLNQSRRECLAWILT